MSMPFVDNIDYWGKKPDFTRQQYDTVAQMKSVKTTKMAEMYIAFCLETRKVYLYNKNNDDDDLLGKWREFGTGTSGSQVQTMPAPSSIEVNNVYQYIGPTTANYVQGYFYICRTDELEEVFWWEHLSTGEVSKITNAEIDYLFDHL